MYELDVVATDGNPGNKLGAFTVTDALQASGWNGGLFVQYYAMKSVLDGSSMRWMRVMGPALPDTVFGFLLRGSYEPADQFTGIYPGRTGVITVCNHGEFLFKYYEIVNLAERTNPGTGGPLTYALNQTLYCSNRGLLTSENETGVARAIAVCSGLPADNENYLGAYVHSPNPKD